VNSNRFGAPPSGPVTTSGVDRFLISSSRIVVGEAPANSGLLMNNATVPVTYAAARVVPDSVATPVAVSVVTVSMVTPSPGAHMFTHGPKLEKPPWRRCCWSLDRPQLSILWSPALATTAIPAANAASCASMNPRATLGSQGPVLPS
jgi:hypothetical protein